MLKFVYEV
ncbi:hypothetical protein CP061683_0087A, partial [Chlamydia psittaci 06-1683]